MEVLSWEEMGLMLRTRGGENFVFVFAFSAWSVGRDMFDVTEKETVLLVGSFVFVTHTLLQTACYKHIVTHILLQTASWSDGKRYRQEDKAVGGIRLLCALSQDESVHGDWDTGMLSSSITIISTTSTITRDAKRGRYGRYICAILSKVVLIFGP